MFKDFLEAYTWYFKPPGIEALIKAEEESNGQKQHVNQNLEKMNNFLVRFVDKMQPRYYVQGEEFIQDQFDEVFEVVFIMKGACAIGYRLFEEIFYGQTMIMKKNVAHNKPKK